MPAAISPLTRDTSRPPGLRPAVAAAIACAVAAATLIGALLGHYVVDDPLLVWRVLGAAAAGGALLGIFAARNLRSRVLGPANIVTLVRGTLTAVLVGLLGSPITPSVEWTVVATAAAALALDGVDGWLARSLGTASRFGARFDMETDALLILVLTLLVWQLGKAGPWIVIAGALRYVFVAAGRVLPWLAAELPPSRRRQTACVVQIVSLILALAPFVSAPWSAGVALIGLLVLVGSFALDVAWLHRHAAA